MAGPPYSLRPENTLLRKKSQLGAKKQARNPGPTASRRKPSEHPRMARLPASPGVALTSYILLF